MGQLCRTRWQVRIMATVGGVALHSSEKPRKTPSASTLSANSWKSMFAIDRLASIEATYSTTHRKLRPGNVLKSSASSKAYGDRSTHATVISAPAAASVIERPSASST